MKSRRFDGTRAEGAARLRRLAVLAILWTAPSVRAAPSASTAPSAPAARPAATHAAGSTGTASGPPSTGVSEEPGVRAAREEFVRGTALAKQSQWDAALEAFERSYRLRPHPITSYNLGYCARAVGQYATARRALRRALADHATETWGHLPDYLVELAERYLTEVEARVVRLEVHLDPADASLSIDGRAPERDDDVGAAFPTAVVLDPGAHVFVASRPGHPDMVVTRHFALGERTSIRLSLAPASAHRAAPARQPSPKRRARASPPFDRRWGFVAIGVGAAGVTAGAIAGAAALRKRSTLRDQCGERTDECPPQSGDDLDALRSYADISTVAFAFGAVALGLGGAALLFLPSERPSGRSSVTPGIGLGWAGVEGSF